MELYVIDNYKSLFPKLSGKELTDELIRLCLGREDIRVERNERGKPFIRFSCGSSPEEEICISVSHSDDTFALLVSDRNAGLDLQYPRKIRADRIAARYFTEDEAAVSAGDDSGNSFFRIWTRKEAYCKYTGLGLEQIMRKDEVLNREDVSFIDIILRDGCYCAVCTGTEEGDKPDEIQITYREQNR